jgi:hypothetical protein
MRGVAWKTVWRFGMEEIGTWSCMSKSKETMRSPGGKTSEETNVQGEVVGLNIADHWNLTGTWRKLSI